MCHPSISKKHLQKFDDRVWQLWFSILSGVRTLEHAVRNRARMKAYLPSRLNGVGLRSWERTSNFAWFASVASSIALRDVGFECALKFLTRVPMVLSSRLYVLPRTCKI